MAEGNDKKSLLETVIFRITALIGAVSLIFGTIFHVITYTKITPELVQAFLAALNVIALITYGVSLTKVPELGLIEDHERKRNYCALLDIKSNDELPTPVDVPSVNAKRVNLLVGQLYTNIIGYTIFLIVVYIIYFFDNKDFLNTYLFQGRDYYKYIHPYLDIATGVFNYLSAVFVFLGFKVLYDQTISNDGKNTPLPYKYNVTFLSVGLLTIYILFSVIIVTASLGKLDQPTLDPIAEIKRTIASYENEPNKPASKLIDDIKNISSAPSESPMDSVSKIKEAVAAYDNEAIKSPPDSIKEIKKIIIANENEAAKKSTDSSNILLNVFKLLIGSFNGLAMALLFGRYISMEHSAYIMEIEKYKKEKKSNKIIHLCTLYILPIYALAQPLFGSFNIEGFGNSRTLANWVFFICLIGKVVFLYLTYLFMKKRLMHLYLHSVITSHGIPKQLINCFDYDFDE